ncbi:MAG: DUF2752 domain-containing protein [Candidatus Angelobacter sp.]
MSRHAPYRAHAMAAALLLGGAVLYIFSPAEHSFYPRCIFHALTGWQCPGCGGTRALHHLLHFHLSEAMHYNALVTLFAPLALGWFMIWYGAVLLRGRGPNFRLSPPLVVCLYFVVLLFGLARNVPFSFLS